MFRWLRKATESKERPDFAKSITADDVFAHLIARIDAADVARNPPPESDPPGASPAVRT